MTTNRWRTRLLASATIGALVLAGCAEDEPEEPIEVDPPATDPDDPDDEAEDAPPDEGDEDDALPDEDEEGTEDDLERLDPDEDEAGRGDATAALSEEIDAAIDDAAGEADVSPDAIEVVTAELVTWPDGALGCPDPDQMYTMALVDGYRIVLDVDGDEEHYHGEDGSAPFHCADPSEPTDDGRVTS